jgi:hypothetical protein
MKQKSHKFIEKIKSIWKSVKLFFSKISIEAKLIMSGAIAVVSFILIVVLRGKANTKSALEYELSKVKHDIEIGHLKKQDTKVDGKLSKLKEKEKELKEKIEFVKKKELKGENVTLEELDNFFDKRGF